MGAQVPAWKARGGEFNTTSKFAFSKVHICPIHFQGHAWIFVVLYLCWNSYKKNCSLDKSITATWWQLDASFLWMTYSRDCIFTIVGQNQIKNQKIRFIYYKCWKFDSVKGRSTTSAK